MKNNTVIAIVISLFLVPAVVYSSAFKGDGKIAVLNYHKHEYDEIKYRDGNRYDREGLGKIAHLFRSNDDKEIPIDVRLVELIDAIQDYFGAETVELISGYRSPSYNKTLRLEGRAVASESLHTLGLAADIHMDEVLEEDVFDYVKKMKIGGVGIYPKHAFVHVDVGPARSWREAPSSTRITVGTEKNPNPIWSLLTDKNEYSAGEKIVISVTNQGYNKEKFVNNFWFERFRKGEWSEHGKIEITGGSKMIEREKSESYFWSLPEDWSAGKYRLVVFANKNFAIPPSQSNEFYVKR